MALAVRSLQKENDLWALAAAQLSQQDREAIDFKDPDKLKALADLQRLTAEAKQRCIDRRWKYTRKSGETVILRDVFDKIVKWIDTFKRVGDNVVQYDPTHAALPWAGIRLVLQVVVNDSARFGSVVEGIESIGKLICRCSIVESLYPSSTSKTGLELEKALIKLYTCVLIYLSEAKRYVNQRSAMRMLKSGLLEESDLDVSLKNVGAAQDEVKQYSDLCDREFGVQNQVELRTSLSSLDIPLQRMSHDLNLISDGLHKTKRTQILQWLSPEPYIGHHEEMKKDVLHGTGQWLLSDPTFEGWKEESASSILWLHGLMGSGKTKLVSIVIEQGRSSFLAGQNPNPVFFYCVRDPAEPARSEARTILASLARQLSCIEPGTPLLKPTVDLFTKKETEGFASGRLRVEESLELIVQLVEAYPLTTIVIDALDECNPDDQRVLLKAIEEILRRSSGLVKVFISSRNDHDIVSRLEEYPNLEITSDRNSDDIAVFVKDRTEQLVREKVLLRHNKSPSEMKKLIVDKTIEGAAGMFRWASMQLQYLSSFKMDSAIRNNLGQLPSDLHTLYAKLYDVLSDLPDELEKSILKTIFHLLLRAQRRINTAEFLALISTSSPTGDDSSLISKDLVLDLCNNFVVFDDQSDTFRFAHLSVREFLEKQREYYSTIDANDPYYYSAIFWPVHYQLAGEARSSKELKCVLRTFCAEDSNGDCPIKLWNAAIASREFFRWSEWKVDWPLRHSLLDTPVDLASSFTVAYFVACAFDLPELIEDPGIAQQEEVNLVNRFGLSPQFVSVGNGSCVMLEKFLDKYGESFQVTEEMVVAAAASLASNRRRTMKLLLDRRGDEIKITETVVWRAAASRKGKEVLALLLDERGYEIKITEKVVRAAMEWEHEEIMALLLDQRGDEVKLTQTLMLEAASDGSEELMALLLDRRGDEIEITDALVKAATRNGRAEVMALLLDRLGDEFKISEATVVKAAAECWTERVVELLLDRRGDEIKITDAVLQAAAGNEMAGQAIMTLLFDRRGDEIKFTGAIAEAAAGNGRCGIRIMTLLLDWWGDEVKITDAVLQEAAGNQEDGLELMKLFFDQRGEEITISEAVIKQAAGNENLSKEMMALLLDRRGDEIKITEGVFEAAASSGQEEVLTGLLDQQNKASREKEKWIKIAQFYNASKNGDIVTVRRLLKDGCPPDTRNPLGRTPLCRAAQGGHAEVMQALLETRAVDVNAQTGSSTTVLFHSADWGLSKMVTLLLEQGADPSIVDFQGRTPLYIADWNGFDEVVDILTSAIHAQESAHSC